MGLFLRSRIVTEISVIVVVLFSTFSTFFYAWTLSRSWPDADKFTKVRSSSLLSLCEALTNFCADR